MGGCALYRSRRRLGGLFPIRELRLVGDEFVGSEGLDVVVRRGLEKPAALAVAELLRARPLESDVLHWVGLRPGAVLLRGEASPWAVADGTEVSNRCPYMILGDGRPATPIRKSFASRVARKSRKLIDRGHLEFLRCRTEDEVEKALTALFDFHQRRWTARGERGSFAYPRKREFYRRVSQRLLCEGRLELFALWEKDLPRAVLFGASAGRTLFYLQSGFDGELESHGPGNVLILQIVRDAQAREFERFDFMKGDESYKYQWTSEEELLVTRRLFSPSWRGRLARVGTTLKRRMQSPPSSWRFASFVRREAR